MRDLAICPLILAEEIQRGARARKISTRVERQRCPEGITSKEPGEARALVIS